MRDASRPVGSARPPSRIPGGALSSRSDLEEPGALESGGGAWSARFVVPTRCQERLSTRRQPDRRLGTTTLDTDEAECQCVVPRDVTRTTRSPRLDALRVGARTRGDPFEQFDHSPDRSPGASGRLHRSEASSVELRGRLTHAARGGSPVVVRAEKACAQEWRTLRTTGPAGQNPGRKPTGRRRVSHARGEEPRRTEFDPQGQNAVASSFAPCVPHWTGGRVGAASRCRQALGTAPYRLLFPRTRRRVRDANLARQPRDLTKPASNVRSGAVGEGQVRCPPRGSFLPLGGSRARPHPRVCAARVAARRFVTPTTVADEYEALGRPIAARRRSAQRTRNENGTVEEMPSALIVIEPETRFAFLGTAKVQDAPPPT